MELVPAQPFSSRGSYARRVRGRRYLWGSAGLLHDVTTLKPVNLHLANDQAGEPVTVGTQVAGGAQTVLGVLQPGELLSLPLHEICGVYAECAGDSIMRCWID